MGDAAKILTEIVSKEGDAEALKLKAPQDNMAAEVENHDRETQKAIPESLGQAL
jgi:hypothetical protein